jgi:adenylate cyclase
VKVFVKSLVYVLIILVFLIFGATVVNAQNTNQPIFSPQVLDSLLLFLSSKALIGILLYIGAVITVVLFVNEVFDYFGRRVSLAYTFGKYHTPKQESRIFMFMDLKSSTTIAEQLGHVTYFKWINQYYRDITEYILESKGDIYQYVGDEIIVTWDMDKGLENERCLECFYRIKKGMDKKAHEYIDRFGVVPQFKAGVHIGEVTTGEIGMIKKDIIYSGDVLNTTARIQASCNSYGYDLLVSDRIAAAFHGLPNYQFQSLGVIYLRGKAKSVGLYAVESRIDQNE